MAAIIQIILRFTTCVIAFFTRTFRSEGKAEKFKVTSYIRGDCVHSAADLNSEDFDIITDLIIFECATFNSKGEVEYDEAKMERVMSIVRTVIADRDIHITLNLLGPRGNTDSDVWKTQMKVQSAEHNKAFKSGVLEKNVLELLKKYGFDGVHFDYEYPITSDAWHCFNKFLISLRSYLRDEYTLGVALSAWNVSLTPRAVSAIDTLELMTYDYVDADGKHATFEDTVTQINKLKYKGVPKDKINIGLPFYSRPKDMSPYWYDFVDCYDKMSKDGWYHCDEINNDCWFNTSGVISQKTEYAINNGFGGVMIWHYSCDIPLSSEDSLLRAIGETVDKHYR